MIINQQYVNWLATWIKNGAVNIKTGLPFTIEDIKIAEYKTAVQTVLNS